MIMNSEIVWKLGSYCLKRNVIPSFWYHNYTKGQGHILKGMPDVLRTKVFFIKLTTGSQVKDSN